MITKSNRQPVSKSMIALIASACTIALMLALVGCGEASPAKTVDTFLKGFQTGDSAAVKSVYDGEVTMDSVVGDVESGANGTDTAAASNETATALADKLRGFKYQVGAENINGDTATVDVTITTYDMGTVMGNFMTEYFQQALPLAFSGASQEQLAALGDQILKEQIESASMDYEKTVPLNLTKKDGKWMVDNLNTQPEFTDALTGGLISAYQSLEQTFGSSLN